MPNHFHLLLTPAPEIPLEKTLQFIKGGFSYRAKREISFPLEIWQASFVNHRIREAIHRGYRAATGIDADIYLSRASAGATVLN